MTAAVQTLGLLLMSVVVWKTNLACCPILMSAWVCVSPVCNTETVLKQVRIWFKSLSLWGCLISCWRNQLFSRMCVTSAESGVPSAVRKPGFTKWCLCFQWLHCIFSWSLLDWRIMECSELEGIHKDYKSPGLAQESPKNHNMCIHGCEPWFWKRGPGLFCQSNAPCFSGCCAGWSEWVFLFFHLCNIPKKVYDREK